MSASPANTGLGLEGAIALVTGGSGGIGASIVEHLAAAGSRVVSTDLVEPDALPDGVAHRPCDLSDPEAVRSLVAAVAEDHDGLDLLVHAAGFTRDRVLWKLDDADWDAVLRIHLDAAFWLLKAAAPWLRTSTRPAVVLLSSINGERGKFGQASYAAAKAGLIGLARSAARELGRDGARVNVVAPGWIDTPMTAALGEEHLRRALEETVLGRVGRPADVAAAVLFLCSDLARHVTGQVLRVDGGQLMA